ncbi:copper resistance protein CopC [Niallia circulans]|uniref:copper resistance CopC family protein n=1 Tax=Niallia circulans TaxID=1397 RepID=UPI00069ECF5C|nr:copper resistance protein CopC [Niallia circulans]
MKKFLFFVLCILMIAPSIVSAHSGIVSSNPKEGETLTEEFNQINLYFNTTINEISTMKLLKDGTEISINDIEVKSKKMIGTLTEPLDNGSYKIEWYIVGKDGHPIRGEINFLVQIEQKEGEKNTTQQITNEEEKSQVQNNNDGISENTDDKNILVTLMGLFLIFAIVVIWFIRKEL